MINFKYGIGDIIIYQQTDHSIISVLEKETDPRPFYLITDHGPPVGEWELEFSPLPFMRSVMEEFIDQYGGC